ncbi:MAG TPA: hypothetical protein VJK05_03330 [archaeon]|nr:hypothetical protein [archaeon]
MKLNDYLNAKGIFFIALFTVLTYVGMGINFSKLVGAENQFFTLFQFFGPIAGSFLGPIAGAVTVLFAQVINFVLTGKQVELINLLRLTPMIFAAIYFGMKKDQLKASAVIPILAMAAFVLHPVGQQVWFFSLYWAIPVLARIFLSNNLFVKSLGATFTAHAVGGAIWIWTIPMTAEAWIALIPVVFVERIAFAFGISASYIAMNLVLNAFESKIPGKLVSLDKNYSWKNVVSVKAQ